LAVKALSQATIDLLPAHIDVYQFGTITGCPCWTLITGGTSDFCPPALEEPPPGIAPRAALHAMIGRPFGAVLTQCGPEGTQP
jgi:hypothetical protein